MIGPTLKSRIVITSVAVLAIITGDIPTATAQSISTNGFYSLAKDGVFLGSETVISPDGLLEAHLGPHSFDDGLFIKDLANGEDKQIVKEADERTRFDNLTFSPDGSHIVFRACPPLGANCAFPELFTVDIDGSHLIRVGESYVGSALDTRYDLVSFIPSPDGKQLLLEVDEVQEFGLTKMGRGYVGTPPETTRYISVISATAADQKPKLLVKGSPIAWSDDCQSVYYESENGLIDIGFEKLDLRTKKSVPVKGPSGSFDVFGKVYGKDALFVERTDTQDNLMTVMNLDGTEPDANLKRLAATIPLRDADHRRLYAIEAIGPHQLRLLYQSQLGVTAPSVSDHHTDVMNF